MTKSLFTAFLIGHSVLTPFFKNTIKLSTLLAPGMLVKLCMEVGAMGAGETNVYKTIYKTSLGTY